MLYGVVPAVSLKACYVAAYQNKRENQIFEPAHIIAEWRKKQAAGVSALAKDSCTLCKAYNEDQSAGICPFHMTEDALPLKEK